MNRNARDARDELNRERIRAALPTLRACNALAQYPGAEQCLSAAGALDWTGADLAMLADEVSDAAAFMAPFVVVAR